MSSSEVCDVGGSGADGGGDQGADGFVELRDGMDATGRGGMSRSTPEGRHTQARWIRQWRIRSTWRARRDISMEGDVIKK